MSWDRIQGQEVSIRILREHLARRRVASAYLFVGPEGVGKRLTAWELATALNCEAGGATSADAPGEASGKSGQACGGCPSCRRIARQVHPDVHEVSTRGAAELIRIEDVRQVLGRVALRPYMGRRQIVIIDGADRLTDEAANSLLKALEEPSPETVFVLLSSQPARCLPTVLSRCQLIRFRALTSSVIEAILVGAKACDAQAARTVAGLAQGSMAQAIALAGDWASYDTIRERLRTGTTTEWAAWTVPNDRDEVARWLSVSIVWLRDALLASSGAGRPAGEADADVTARLAPEPCAEAALALVELYHSLDRMANPRLIGALLRERWLNLLNSPRGGKWKAESEK
ncbi:MAG: DNA polymerase III subunit delta' [Candidatus Omnitrophica bacterium]|nr:DNA polymerase III subunit delta' [Candidatus Omnitrophota bacterium]